ncbi:MAG: hypothetical protein EBZ49_11755 [Proteobacteria bacterium]|nr:hypothetical protein [Pseudomonadota bacterium]
MAYNYRKVRKIEEVQMSPMKKLADKKATIEMLKEEEESRTAKSQKEASRDWKAFLKKMSNASIKKNKGVAF